jgi:hypothetical protein
MRQLGPGTIPALDRFIATAGHATPEQLREAATLRDGLAEAASAGADWRSWTWRRQRLGDYLAAHPFAPRPPAR